MSYYSTTTTSTSASEAFESLSLALRSLRELPASAVPQVAFDSPAAQAFAELALSGSIIWDNVRVALRQYYGTVGRDDGGMGTNDPRGPSGNVVLGGDFGLELVVRVMKRFERFQLADDEKNAVELAGLLKQAVWAEVDKCSGKKLDSSAQGGYPALQHPSAQSGSGGWGSQQSTNGQQQHQIFYTQSTTHTLGAMHNPYYQHTQQQQQQHDLSPSHFYGVSQHPQLSHSEPAAQVPPSSSPTLEEAFAVGSSGAKRPRREEGEGEVKPRVSYAEADDEEEEQKPQVTPKKDKKDKKEFEVGNVAQAKMMEPRDKGVCWPCMIFESSLAPANVYGKRVSTSYLVAPLPASGEWHWVPPSRMRAIAAGRIPKLLGDAKVANASVQLQYSTASSDPTIDLVPGKRVLVDSLGKKAKDARDLVQAWKMIEDKGEAEGSLSQWKMGRVGELKGGGGEGGEGSVGEGSTPRSEVEEVGSPDTPATEPEVWCICRQEKPGDVLIGCDDDSCAIQWYHASCVGLSGKQIPGDEDEWTCATCSSKRKMKA